MTIGSETSRASIGSDTRHQHIKMILGTQPRCSVNIWAQPRLSNDLAFNVPMILGFFFYALPIARFRLRSRLMHIQGRSLHAWPRDTSTRMLYRPQRYRKG